MRPLSSLEFVALECWFFAVYLGFATPFYLLRTLYLLLHCKTQDKNETVNQHYSPYIILLSMMMFFGFSRFERLPLLPTAICIGGWLIIPLCVILQKKLISRKSWQAYLEDNMGRFFHFLDTARTLLLYAEQKFAPTIPSVFLGCIALLAIYIMCTQTLPNILFVFALFALPVLYFGIQYAMHSCRKLLWFWFSHGLLFSVGVAASVHLPIGTAWHTAGVYAIFILLYTSLWLFTTGVADDVVAKMATSVVNTGTTILAILINVLCGWGMTLLEVQLELLSTLNQMQFYANLILLPLIVSGYLAALLKEMQIYWSNRPSK